jgi:transcription elongation GreA/GreB family factor
MALASIINPSGMETRKVYQGEQVPFSPPQSPKFSQLTLVQADETDLPGPQQLLFI